MMMLTVGFGKANNNLLSKRSNCLQESFTCSAKTVISKNQMPDSDRPNHKGANKSMT